MGTFARIEGKIPFAIPDVSQKYPIRLGAKLDDGNPAPWFTGPLARSSVRVTGDNSSFTLMKLYDANGNLLPSFSTTAFQDGGWEGFFEIRQNNTINNNFGLEFASLHPDENAGGNSNVCFVTSTPPPTPLPTPPPTEPPPAGRIITRVRVIFSDGTKQDIV